MTSVPPKAKLEFDRHVGPKVDPTRGDRADLSARDQTLTLRDGRTLGYAEYGDPGGAPGFYFHGHPGSRLEAQLADDAARAAGIKAVALDRPGYGLSSPQPGRRILDWPYDGREARE